MWLDEGTGEGRLCRNGHEYLVNSSEVEPVARVPLARVHFDIKRQHGIQRAVNVTLRPRPPSGTPPTSLRGPRRSRPSSERPSSMTDNRPGIDWSFEGHPVQLVEEWARLVGRRELSTLRLLYAPEVVLHVGSEHVSGRDAVIDRMRDDFS
jgi:hypothetical protein